MKETRLTDRRLSPEPRSFLAFLATILEVPAEQLPRLSGDDDPAGGWRVSRWLGERGLGLVPIAQPATFTRAGLWIARVASSEAERRYVVMYGVPSGVVWDPDGDGAPPAAIDAGFVVAAGDVACQPAESIAISPGSRSFTERGLAFVCGLCMEPPSMRSNLPAVGLQNGNGWASARQRRSAARLTPSLGAGQPPPSRT